jgi:hypothetical protein
MSQNRRYQTMNKHLFNAPEMQHLSISAARDVVKKAAKKGVVCPCCSRLVKVYRRKIHAEMVLWLIGLYKLCSANDGYYTTVDIARSQNSKYLKVGGTDGTFLIHWGLIEKIPATNRGGAPARSYKITKKGIDFVDGKINIWKWVELLNGELMDVSTEGTDIHQALGSKFNYNELMNGL